jgi:stage IV sporulation protein FB
MKKLTIKLGFVFLCALFAGLNSANGFQFASWVLVIFVSILFHELGHALTAACFGKASSIELGFFGGVTYFRQEGLKRWQLFLIALNGPVFGFLLFLAASFLSLKFQQDALISFPLRIAAFINLFWTLFNLIPILPLDGGQLLRMILEAIFKSRGLLITGIFSSAFSVVLALVAFLVGQYFIGAILFMFAFQNFELVKQAKCLSDSDKEDSYRKTFQEALFLFETGKLDEALPIIHELREKTKSGMIFNQATMMLALALRSKKQFQEIYVLLKPYPKLYQNELPSLMQEAAFFMGDMELTYALSAEAFQKQPSKDVAFHSAVAASALKHDEAVIGWLKTALELGLNEDEIKAHPMLKGYADRLSL